MKKFTLLALLIVALLAFGGLMGCDDAEEVVEDVVDTPDETPEETPDTDDDEVADVEIPDEYSIEIYTYYAGTTTYVIGAGLAELINENSEWLRATALEAPGAPTNKMMLKMDEDMRDKAFVQGFVYHALIGAPPFEEPYYDLREVTSYGVSVNFFMTNNPDIRTIEDLDGKRVAVGTRPHVAQVDMPLLYLEMAGVSVTPEYLGHADGAEEMRDGNVDALFSGGLVTASDFETVAPVPVLAELLAMEDMYFISLDEELHNAALAELGMPLVPGPITIPPYGFHESQDYPVIGRGEAISWIAHKDMPDYVVKEFLRIIYENTERFAELVPAGAYVSPDTMSHVGLPEHMHEAAIEFYRDNGIYIPELDD